MINGLEYAFMDLQIVVEGNSFPLTGVQEINYKSTANQGNIFGAGARPVAMGRGYQDFEGNIVLLQSALEAMQQAFGNGSLVRRLPFLITCSYAPALIGAPIVTDVLQGCRINEVEKGMKYDALNMVVNLPLTIFNIIYNK